MPELKALKTQRSAVKGEMTRMLNWVTAADPNIDVDDINSRLIRCKDLLNQFTTLEAEILELDPDGDSQICDFNETYLTVESGLNRALRNLNGGSDRRNSEIILNTSQTTGQHEVKLPKIHIPPFSGEFTEWQTFYDLFVATIHNNDNLSPAQKFQYLQTLLTGPASSIMKHLSITEQNYFEVFKKLCKKYDRKRHTINSFIQTFHNQPNIHTATASTIQKLMDTSDEVIRGLKAMGKQAESRDPWLIYVLMKKLDDETKSQWAQHAFDKDFPNLDEFFEFLQRRIDALDSLQMCTKPPQKSKSLRAHFVTDSSVSCPICPHQNHALSVCSEFLNMTVNDRREVIKAGSRCFNCLQPNHAVYRCFSKKRCSTCNRKHHTLLHLPLSTISDNDTGRSHQPSTSTQGCTESANCLHINNSEIYSILPTALVNVKDARGENQRCRVLLDSASVSSFVSEDCVNRLKLKWSAGSSISISGLGNNSVGKSSGSIELQVSSILRRASPINVKAFIIPRITSRLPEQTIPKRYFKQFVDFDLADPAFNVAAEIDILLGIDHFFDILEPNQIKAKNSNSPTAQNTIFGWILGGKWTQSEFVNTFFIDHTHENSTTDELLKRFWELEEVQCEKLLSEEERNCEEIFTTSTTINSEGRYIVKLPFKCNQPSIGESLPLAITRLRAMERRFSRDTHLFNEYKRFMKEYEDLGHMRELSKPIEHSASFYLPHHGIIKSSSTTTKLRVVFDGSAKSSSGQSLNSQLMVGPTVQNPLYAVVLRFRIHKVVFTADVEKMYRQILVAPTDTSFQRIVWRESIDQPIRHFELLTVTYGTASAPFLATRVLKEISLKNASNYPIASEAILKDMYVDDMMSGAACDEDAIEKKNDVVMLLKSAGMSLRKFVSNSSQFMSTLSEDQYEKITPIDSMEICDDSSTGVKVLGLHWNPTQDMFTFRVNLRATHSSYTKRRILSEISQIFDPIGWLAPSLVRNKIFLQKLWLCSLQWDDKIPEALNVEWTTLRRELEDIQLINIPRWFSLSTVEESHIHGFCDASEQAYAAAVYIVIKNVSGVSKCSLVSAKTKVAPIKQVSLPRLELCGATLLVKLMKTVVESLELNITSVNAWTDSTIVLDWLADHPKRWKTFIANRTSEILQSTSRSQWRHVPSQENPADIATRGLAPSELSSFELWWTGPQFLHSSSDSWPTQSIEKPTHLLEERSGIMCYTMSLSFEFMEQLCERYSNFFKLTRVVALLFRFIHNLKNKATKSTGSLTPSEIEMSSTYIVQRIQEAEFPCELKALTSKREISPKSSLKSLNPFIDDSGIMRVGGRITHSTASFQVKHPILLPFKSTITRLIVQTYHTHYYHAGATLLLSLLRQKFWVIRARDVIRGIIRRCVICFRAKPKPEEQQMGNLPNCRVEYIRPFLKVAVDYAGPMLVYPRRGRGQKSFKAYICYFVCLSTRAIHIELVCDLTSESFLAALRRFIARRGICTDIYSDCGTNFVGANNQLVEMFKFLKQNALNLSHSLSKDQITWHFNPAGAPHFNGIAEAAVKSSKAHLRKTIGNTILTVEELTTLLVQIEAILNSRPLCVLSSEDIDALTPAHFILHHPITQIPEPDLRNEKISHLTRWQLVQQLQQHFAQRWRREYLTSLQQRSKWTHKRSNVEIGDIVIVKDDNLPPTKWMLARVHEVMPGSDDLVRAVLVKTENGIISRPIHKLCKLPLC